MTDNKSPDILGETGQLAGRTDTVSRRAWLGGAAMIAGFGATCLMAASASAKTPQVTAKYQDKPQGSAKCSGCSQFEAPESCKLVDGKISPEGWCQLYTPKAG